MSGMRISGGQAPVIATPTPASSRSAPASQSDAPRNTVSPEIAKESFISSLSAGRQPPKMSLGAFMSNGPTSVVTMFAKELEDLGSRSADEVAGDLAMLYLQFSDKAKSEGDGDLTKAFDEMGELMRGYEHLRMLQSGELG